MIILVIQHSKECRITLVNAILSQSPHGNTVVIIENIRPGHPQIKVNDQPHPPKQSCWWEAHLRGCSDDRNDNYFE